MLFLTNNKTYARIASSLKTSRKLIKVLFSYVFIINLVKKHSPYHWMPVFFLVFSITPNTAYSEIWIEEVQQAELPLALLPTGSKKIVLEQNSSLGPRTSASIVGGQHFAGQYLIKSDTASAITINLTSDDNIQSVQLNKFQLKYNNLVYSSFPASGLDNPGISGTYVTVGFTAIIKSGAPEGVSEPSFTIDVTEDQP